MRAYEGQFSGSRSMKRTLAEKKKLLAELEQDPLYAKRGTHSGLKASIKVKIDALRNEIDLEESLAQIRKERKSG
jgi:hypothetical protein